MASRLPLALVFRHPGYDQETAVTPAPEAKPSEQPWLYENSDIPVDKSWTFGTLDNGLRYAVKRNLVPAGQVSIRVRIDAGALHERDDELGFAHLIEHLSFRRLDIRARWRGKAHLAAFRRHIRQR